MSVCGVQYTTAATSSLSNSSQNRKRTHHTRVSTYSNDKITSKVFSNIGKKISFQTKYRFSKPLINGVLPLKQLPGELLYLKGERKVKNTQD